jgi:uncharacterized membrane protein
MSRNNKTFGRITLLLTCSSFFISHYLSTLHFYYSILFVQKMCAFRRLVLECFHQQKTTKITLNFPKIIEMHLNSSSQCIQLAMRQVNRQGKNNYGKEKNSNLFVLTLGSNSQPSAYALSVVPVVVNLLYIYRLFLASVIYDCINTYTIVLGQGYSSSRAVPTL